MKKAILIFSLTGVLVSLSANLLGQTAKRKKRITEADFKRKVESPCGIRQSFDDRKEETKVEWRFVTDSKDGDEYFYYNTRKMLCEPSSVLKIWIKTVETKTKNYSLQRYELKCRADQFRVVSATDYDKDGRVLDAGVSDSERWTDVVPDSVGDLILVTVCHK